MSSITSFDWAAMIADLTGSGMTLEQIARGNELVGISRYLLKYYAEGGQPNFPRGYALLALWCERMEKDESQAPMVQWSSPFRAEGNEMVLKPVCPACKRVIRGAPIAVWRQQEIDPRQVDLEDVWKPPVRQADTQGKKRGRPSKLARLVLGEKEAV